VRLEKRESRGGRSGLEQRPSGDWVGVILHDVRNGTPDSRRIQSRGEHQLV
jgi:hypothetical protein